MKAAVWHDRRDVRVEEVPDPTIRVPEAFEMFQHKRDGGVKVVFTPGGA
jgi:Alcohol dehydrogenase GroES-associated